MEESFLARQNPFVMSLPSATAHLGAALHRWSPSSSAAAATPKAADGFAAIAGQVGLAEGKITKSERGFRDLPGYGRVETVKLTKTYTDAGGKTIHKVEELAVCPECGTVNCACLARVTLQSRIEEENASGDRAQEKPQPFAVVPQTFNQLAVSFAGLQGQSAPRMFG